MKLPFFEKFSSDLKIKLSYFVYEKDFYYDEKIIEEN